MPSGTWVDGSTSMSNVFNRSSGAGRRCTVWQPRKRGLWQWAVMIDGKIARTGTATSDKNAKRWCDQTLNDWSDHRSNPSSYAGDPYWTRARFKGECCKCHGVVRKGDPIYYYPKGKRVYCDGASCGKAANQDFISMRDDEDMYNRRNPSRRNPDYDALNKEHRRLRTMLTRAKNSGDPKKVIAACRAAVKAWAGWPAWPDDWHRWENALGDAQPWGPGRLELSDLESRANPKRRNPSHPDCPGVSATHQHYQGKCSTDWNWGVGPKSNEARKTWPRHGASAVVLPGYFKGTWTWIVHRGAQGVGSGEVGSSNAAKAAATDFVNNQRWVLGPKRSISRRSNPSLGMPGMPHTWVTASGVHVRGGDTVEFWDIAGHPRGHNPKKVRAKVNKMLVFDDHVQVSKGWAGTRVDDRNFIRVVRRA